MEGHSIFAKHLPQKYTESDIKCLKQMKFGNKSLYYIYCRIYANIDEVANMIRESLVGLDIEMVLRNTKSTCPYIETLVHDISKLTNFKLISAPTNIHTSWVTTKNIAKYSHTTKIPESSGSPYISNFKQLYIATKLNIDPNAVLFDETESHHLLKYYLRGLFYILGLLDTDVSKLITSDPVQYMHMVNTLNIDEYYKEMINGLLPLETAERRILDFDWTIPKCTNLNANVVERFLKVYKENEFADLSTICMSQFKIFTTIYEYYNYNRVRIINGKLTLVPDKNTTKLIDKSTKAKFLNLMKYISFNSDYPNYINTIKVLMLSSENLLNLYETYKSFSKLTECPPVLVLYSMFCIRFNIPSLDNVMYYCISNDQAKFGISNVKKIKFDPYKIPELDFKQLNTAPLDKFIKLVSNECTSYEQMLLASVFRISPYMLSSCKSKQFSFYNYLLITTPKYVQQNKILEKYTPPTTVNTERLHKIIRDYPHYLNTESMKITDVFKSYNTLIANDYDICTDFNVLIEYAKTQKDENLQALICDYVCKI